MTGRLVVSAVATRRDAAAFLQHLRHELGQYRVIRVICDDPRFHRCRAVEADLAQVDGQIGLHFLPTYAPEINPRERVWW